MRKSGLLIIAFSVIMLAGCQYRTCATYTRKPENMEKAQPEDQEKQVLSKADAERV